MKQHNCAIVGLGGMGNWHRELICGNGSWNSRDCEAIERLNLVGSFDIRQERQEFARSVGLVAYDSLDALLADDTIDLVICAVPNDVHLEIVQKSLEAGKNVVCEKPVALNSEQVLQMMEVAKKTNKKMFVHQNRRWDEDYLAIKNLYDQQLLGQPYRIESRVQGSRGIPGDWRQKAAQGGGMVLDWGVHLLDQALQMIPHKVNRVYSSLTHVTNTEVDDGFTVELTFENGIVFLVEVGTRNFVSLPRWYVLCPQGTAIMQEFCSAGKMVSVEDFNTKDAVPVRTAAGLTKTMAPRTQNTIIEQPLPSVQADIRDFYENVLDVIEEKAQPIVTMEQVLRVMRLMETIFESAEKQQVVTFEPSSSQNV